MVTKSPLLQKYSLPAERARGLIFVEKFASEADVEANGGSLVAPASVSNDTLSVSGGSLSYASSYARFSTEDFTISCWIKIALVAGEVPFVQGSSTAPIVRVLLTDDPGGDGYARLIANDGTNGTSVYTGSVVADGDWHHLAFSCPRGGTAYAYVDGVPGSGVSFTPALSLDNSSHAWTFLSGGGLAYEIKEFRIHHEALTAQEVADLANNSTFNYLNKQPTFIVPMTMDKHQGSTLLDNQLESWFIRGPIKQASRGYFFDGAYDRLASESKTNLPTDACTFIALVEPQYDVANDSYTWVMGNQSSNASNGAMMFSKGSDGYGWVFSVNEHSGTVSGSAVARSGNAAIPDGPAVLVGVYDKTEERIEIWINGENQSNTVVKTGPWEDINNVTDKYVIGQIFDVGTVYSYEGIIGFSAVLPFALNPTQIKDISALLKRTQQEV